MLKNLLSGVTIGTIAIASNLSLTQCAHSFTPATLPQATSTAPKLIAQADPSLAAMEQSILKQINQYRATRKLPALKLDSSITQQARLHSQNMASGRVSFGHQGFDQRIQEIGKTIAYRAAAENVAYNMGYKDPATQTVQGWLKSPGHLRNIQGQFNLTGIGVSKNAKNEIYFTQLFIRG
ncbi:CAP domain-containing protein [Phormidesmis sp. 146-12]